jgi:hypothetical protein
VSGSIRLFEGGPDTGEWLVTTAIGGDYLARWQAGPAASWFDYAQRHGLGIAVAVGDLPRGGEPDLNGAWQKLLAPRALRDELGSDVRCALLDTDVFISPGAASVFTQVPLGHIGVVSEQRDLPMPIGSLQNRVAWLRRSFRDAGFPLSSALNATPSDLARWAGLEPVSDDAFCTGVMVIDTEAHAHDFVDWYVAAPTSAEYLAVDWGEQTWVNNCVLRRDDVHWLPYEWQALWLLEMAAHYPFLYASGVPVEVVQWCFASSLMRNNFLHLAGRWEGLVLDGLAPDLPGIEQPFAAFAAALRHHEASATRPELRGLLLPPGPTD